MKDRVLAWTLRATATTVAALLLLIAAFLLSRALPALQEIRWSRFVTDEAWRPTDTSALFGIVPMVAASAMVTLGAVVLAAPLGITSAVFCHFYASPWTGRQYRRVIELLAGIPSVVYGFWGLTVLVPLLQAIAPPGQSLLAGILVLAIMILPTVALLSDAAIAGVPHDYLRGGAALGLARAGILRRIVLPAARPGILAGIMLAAARAVGETLAVLMVCGNVIRFPASVFDPVRALTAHIALELPYATGVHASALFVTGLILMLIVVGLMGIAERITHGRVFP